MPTPGVCRDDADCSSQANGIKGRCAAGDAPGDACSCAFSCAVDDDCPRDQICLCDGDGGRCVVSTCAVNDDCDRGLLCINTAQRCGGELFACQTPRDICASDLDCKGGKQCFLRGGRRVCEPPLAPESCGASDDLAPAGPLRTASLRRLVSSLGTQELSRGLTHPWLKPGAVASRGNGD